jgi:hypothetical protein
LAIFFFSALEEELLWSSPSFCDRGHSSPSTFPKMLLTGVSRRFPWDREQRFSPPELASLFSIHAMCFSSQQQFLSHWRR